MGVGSEIGKGLEIAAEVGREAHLLEEGLQAGKAIEGLRADSLARPAIVDSTHLGSMIGPGTHTFEVGETGRKFQLLVPNSMAEIIDPKQGTSLGYLFDGVTGADNFTYDNLLRQLRIKGEDGLAEHTATPFVTLHPDIKRGMIGGMAKLRAWDMGDPTFGLTPQTPGHSDITEYFQRVNAQVEGMLPVNPNTRFGVGFSEGPWAANRWQVAEGERTAAERAAMLEHAPQAQPQGFFSDLLYMHPTLGDRDLVALRTGNVPKTNVTILFAQNDQMLPVGKRMPEGNPYYEGGRGLMTALMPEAAKSRPQLMEEFWRRANVSSFGNIVDSNPIFDRTRYVGVDGHELNVYYLKGPGAMHGIHGSPDVQPFIFRYTGQQLPREKFDSSRLLQDTMPVNSNGARAILGRVPLTGTAR